MVELSALVLAISQNSDPSMAMVSVVCSGSVGAVNRVNVDFSVLLGGTGRLRNALMIQMRRTCCCSTVVVPAGQVLIGSC